MKIHIVMGTTGEYSDRSEWPVMAYWSEVVAQKHAEDATKRAKEIETTRPNRYRAPKDSNEFDSNMSMDYTGTDYYLMDVELAE